jgi:hypothetical protein
MLGASQEVLETLVDAGASPTRGDTSGRSPLQSAVALGKIDAARYLIAAAGGRDAVAKDANALLVSGTRHGPAMVQCLLELRTDWSAGDLMPAVQMAIAYDAASAVELLLEAGADPDQAWADPNSGHARAWTPLQSAAAQNASGCARVLLTAGADPTLTDAEGRTPADRAEEGGYSKLAQLLREAEAQWEAEGDRASLSHSTPDGELGLDPQWRLGSAE